MNTEAEKKEALIKEIVERELAMFLATPNEGGTSECQTRPQSFRMMRRMNHCTHDAATLESYLDGKLGRLEELEQERMPYFDDPQGAQDVMRENRWHYIVSGCSLMDTI